MEMPIKEINVKKSVEMVLEDKQQGQMRTYTGIILTKMNVMMATRELEMVAMKIVELKEDGVAQEVQQLDLIYALQFVEIGHTMIENSVMMVI
jgi:hypothetical protein